ncbi:group III truncated hemoglobin [Aquimarina sp. 2201CG14-23]|uniref:group III truncated hemoglobin n=1 Tax=Aquimarina mycalae TaxID=3040073 RepID=UPI00247829FC|nr:group III truncated hemoglobin [Aquimarina sp. 2201CG14-23]MDH7448300.1 group III truncated hemoglobin [Aquimarina sp. 2201CG14-23]
MKTSFARDIETREDVYTLVSQFYSKIRKEEILGPIFNYMIHNWEEHLNRLTDFWETNLLFVAKYKGNPIKVHQQVDVTFKGHITEKHFGIWLNLWFETIDKLYEGEKAETAKRRARKMSTHLFIKMYESRTTNKTICPFLKENSNPIFK